MLAAAMLTACGAKDEAVPAANYIAVYEEATQPTETSEASETIPEIEITPLTPENGFTYLQNTLFIGDGVCSIISESGLLPEEQVISLTVPLRTGFPICRNSSHRQSLTYIFGSATSLLPMKNSRGIRRCHSGAGGKYPHCMPRKHGACHELSPFA